MNVFSHPVTKVFAIAIGILILLYISLPVSLMFNVPPHIKNLLWIIFIVSGLLLLITYINPQKSLPPPLPPPDSRLEDVIKVKGTIVNFGNNPIGDIDKILLQQGNQRVWLHFPPHTAKQVMNVAVKNTTVNATIRNGKMPPHDSMMRYELISLSSDVLGKTINVRDIMPPAAVRGREMEVKGISIELKLDDKGNAAAFILSGKLVEFHRHTAETLLPLMKEAHQIIVHGYERSPSDGFVNNTGLSLIKPYTITIDNINYVIQ